MTRFQIPMLIGSLGIDWSFWFGHLGIPAQKVFQITEVDQTSTWINQLSRRPVVLMVRVALRDSSGGPGVEVAPGAMGFFQASLTRALLRSIVAVVEEAVAIGNAKSTASRR